MKKLVASAVLLLFISPALAESRYAQARELAFETLNHQHESTRTSGNICALGLPTDAQRHAISAALASVAPPTPEAPDPKITAAITNPEWVTERTWLDPLILAVIADDVAMLERMEAAGHPLQARAGGLLLDAANFGSRHVLHYLLAHDAALDTTNEVGATALIAAASNDRLDMARILLEAGASPNLATQSGAVALVYAVGCRNQPMVDLLLSSGAIPNDKVRQLAIQHGMRLDVANR